MRDPREVDVRELKDRCEIERLLYLYAEMLDRQRWSLMDEIFALEATIDFESAGGIHGPFRQAMAWVARTLDFWPKSIHTVSNPMIDFDGESEAHSRCYFRGELSRQTHDGSRRSLSNAGIFSDRLLRTADGWRIVERHVELTHMQGDPIRGHAIPV